MPQYTTDELLQELNRRHDEMVFIGYPNRTQIAKVYVKIGKHLPHHLPNILGNILNRLRSIQTTRLTQGLGTN